jgi:hypothetical protein
MAEKHDGALEEVLQIMNSANGQNDFNPYFQAKRDEYTINVLKEVNKDILLHITGQDIVLCLDKNNSTIFCQLADTFKRLLKKSLEQNVIQAYETYSTLHHGPLPDVQRHGIHWSNWLLKRPDLDFRNPANDPRLAKSVVFHFKYGCVTGRPVPKEKGPLTKADSSTNIADYPHVIAQQEKFLHGALAIETAILKWIFHLLEPELCDRYKTISQELANFKASRGEQYLSTLRDEVDPFGMVAVLINAHTTDHTDQSDWKRGFAGLVALGEYEGGDLLLRELGLLIEAKSSTAQLMRGRELRHSISEYTGSRFCLVCVTPEGIRVWAEERINSRAKESEEVTNIEENKEIEEAKTAEKTTLGKRERENPSQNL